MATKKVSEARTKYTAKTKRDLTDRRKPTPRPESIESITTLNRNVLELQAKLDEVNRRLAAFEFRLDAQPLSLNEKREWVDRLCGAWAADSSLKAIFAEITQRRTTSAPRKADFDVAA